MGTTTAFWTTLGSAILFLSCLSVIALYRLLKLGRYMNVLPYTFVVLGTACLMIDRPAHGFAAGLVVLVITLIMHAAVLSEIRKDQRALAKQKAVWHEINTRHGSVTPEPPTKAEPVPPHDDA